MGTNGREQLAFPHAGAPEPLPNQRPPQPDPHILEEALCATARFLGAMDVSELRWIVGPPVTRPRSTIFPLTAIAGRRQVSRAYYKIWRLDSHLHGDARIAAGIRLRRSLQRAAFLDSRVVGLTGDDPIQWPRVLATDPESAISVNLAVSGVALGKAVRSLGTKGRRGCAKETYRLLGRAVAVIEGSAEANHAEASELLARRIALCEWRARQAFTGAELAALLRRVHTLHDAVLVEEEAVYAHGDLSASNVLVSHQGIGIIDLSWKPSFPGLDLSEFVVRLQSEKPQLQRWTAALVDEVLGGYGDPDVCRGPAWELARLGRLLAAASQFGRWPFLSLRASKARRLIADLSA